MLVSKIIDVRPAGDGNRWFYNIDFMRTTNSESNRKLILFTLISVDKEEKCHRLIQRRKCIKKLRNKAGLGTTSSKYKKYFPVYHKYLCLYKSVGIKRLVHYAVPVDTWLLKFTMTLRHCTIGLIDQKRNTRKVKLLFLKRYKFKTCWSCKWWRRQNHWRRTDNHPQLKIHTQRESPERITSENKPQLYE